MSGLFRFHVLGLFRVWACLGFQGLGVVRVNACLRDVYSVLLVVCGGSGLGLVWGLELRFRFRLDQGLGIGIVQQGVLMAKYLVLFSI